MTLWQTFGKFVCSQSVTELIFRDANFNAARSSTYTEILAKLFSKKELTITHKNKKNRQLTHSYYENPKCDNSQQLLRNVKQQIFRDANFYAVPSPCFLRNQIFAKFDNLIRDFSEIR